MSSLWTPRIQASNKGERTCLPRNAAVCSDMILTSPSAVGPAEVLFEEPFFRALHRAVRPGGIICTQAESIWFHLPIIKSLATMCGKIFEGGSISYGRFIGGLSFV